MMFFPACVMVVMMMMMIVSMQVYGYRSCIESERKGLLELNAYVNSQFPYDWPNDTNSDCCRWERVECDLTSGRVIGLFLNHTYNGVLPLNLSLFHPFGELQTLNLSNLWCKGWFDDIYGYQSLGKLKNLETLDLSENGINNSVLPFITAASSLKILILHGNYLKGSSLILQELQHLRNLELLDLSMNEFIGPVPDLGYFHKLQSLDLSDNEFSGSLENKGLCQLKNLLELDLSQNKFTGPFPKCFGSLTKLQVLDISSNQFHGTVPSFIRNLESIEYLSLLDNDFESFFSFELVANFSKLKVFKLSSRSSLLHVQTEISWQPRFQLSVIQLQNCNLEIVPSFLGHQKDLRVINLSNNKLTGAFPSWFLEQYPKLRVFLLQDNSFTMFQFPRLLLTHSLQTLDVSNNNFVQRLPKNIGNVLPNTSHLNISNNGFQGNLPSSIGEMKMIIFLDMSHNNFSGSLPMNFLTGCDSLYILKLSYNLFSGQMFPKETNLSSLALLIANNNLFTEIADGLLHSNDLTALDVSNNDLRGVIPSWLGGFRFTYLSVSNNLLEGTIPSNLFKISNISLLDLSGNKFSGNLPPHFSCDPVGMLFLNDNEFSGLIPDTLLENIMVLDLRNNNLSGTIPRFVNTVFIQYLLLRGNKLTGHIPKGICSLTSIKILDLANNNLNGSIPSCLNNISFGRSGSYKYGYAIATGGLVNERGSYFGSLVLPTEFDPEYSSDLEFIIGFASKSRYDSYTERSFNFMLGLDLSNNELSGELPKELGDLRRIRALNLSHNYLSGLIPESFSNLADIESIDLSFNALRGPIPQDLSKLDYMVVFNVSYNNLSGSIPSQGKFSTLDETNYISNPLLCGTAINRYCDDDYNTTGFIESDSQSEDDEAIIDMDIFYWSLTLAVTWITFVLFSCFDSPWRQAWFRFVDTFISFFKCV